jgi:hypothetical protein
MDMDDAYDAIVNEDERFELLADIMFRQVPMLTFRHLDTSCRHPILKAQTNGPSKKDAISSAEIIPCSQFTYLRYGRNYHSDARLTAVTTTRNAAPANVHERFTPIAHCEAGTTMFKYNNDHDFTFANTFQEIYHSRPQTPDLPFPDILDVKALRKVNKMFVRTSFGIWMLTRLRDDDDVHYKKFRPIELQLGELLIMNTFEDKTHGPRNKKQLKQLQTILRLANARLVPSNIAIAYFPCKKQAV